MAGAGFKTFNTGDVLTSSDVNTYLMQQTVMVFDDASARSTALPTPSEGMFSYLKDTNLTYRYDGSAWLSDAGTTSPLTTKGDVWGYSTSDARVPVGADGTVLTADSGETLGIKWAAASSGSFTKIASTSFSAVTSQDFDSVFTTTYDNYLVVVNNVYSVQAGLADDLWLRFKYGASVKASGYYAGSAIIQSDGTASSAGVENAAQIILATNLGRETSPTSGHFFVKIGRTAKDQHRRAFINGQWFQEYGAGGGATLNFGGSTREDQDWTGFRLLNSAGNNIYGRLTVFGMEL